MTETDPVPVAEPLFQEILEIMGRTVRSCAGEDRSSPRGWVARTPSLPDVWSLNQVRIAGPVSFSEAVAIADVEQDGLPFRHVVIEDDATGRELEAQFASAGWDVDREVYMVLGDDPVVAPIKVTEFAQLSEKQGLLLIRVGAVERQPGISASGLDQLVEYARREGSLWAEERYGVLDRDGSPLAMTKLRLDGHVAWVEDVFTVPAARGRGLARALVTHVSALAQKSDANFVFLAADDNDWPKHLYESIGFRPVGYTRTFHRRLESSN